MAIEARWGELPLRIGAYTTTRQLPLELISSVALHRAGRAAGSGLQVVFTATVTERDGEQGQPWTDLDGHEVAWRLATLDEAAAASSRDELARVFPALLRE